MKNKLIWGVSILGILIVLGGGLFLLNNDKQVTQEEREAVVREYIRENISELSPEPEVLGGTFMVTNIEFTGENSGIVEYEDGHIALVADFEYSFTGNDLIVTLENNVSSYFMDRMITLGVEDVGQPIEGFDNNLLTMAFPGLVPADFDGVETVEGYYEVNGDEVVFIRNRTQPITSAERMISEQGYETLLENVSTRLNLSVTNEAEVDELIEEIDTE